MYALSKYIDKFKIQFSNCTRVERLADFLSSSALISFTEFVLRVRLELIDELQQTFRKIVNELEELDWVENESDLAGKFDDILVTLKSSISGKILNRDSQTNSHSTFDGGVASHDCGNQQR